MTKNYRTIFLILSFLLFLNPACSTKLGREDSFLSMYPGLVMNQDITIVVDEQHPKNTKMNGQPIFFILYNNSSGDFVFKSGENQKIYSYNNQENQWQEVQNTLEYYHGAESVIVPASGTGRGGVGLTAFTPYVPDLETAIELRFLVNGEIISSSGEATPAGVYVDVAISP